MEVVGKDAVKANMTVDDEGEGERSIECATDAVSDGTHGHEGNEGGTHGALKGPVVRTVRGRGGGEGGWVIDGALDVGCEESTRYIIDQECSVSLPFQGKKRKRASLTLAC